ncbi:MAG: GDYXXLXY domain-containing protein [Aliihoeflea sp.]
MTKGRYLIFGALAVSLIQIGFLVTMITSRAAILRDGHEIVLQTQPIDPRDLLRGDYVILGYSISNLPAELIEPAHEGDDADGTRDVHVRLAPDADGFHQVVAARLDTPPAAPKAAGEVDIRGRIHYWSPGGRGVFFATYGLERYYVPEGEGLEIELGMLERQFTIRAAVSSSGAAQIKSFHDGDRMLYAEPWY